MNCGNFIPTVLQMRESPCFLDEKGAALGHLNTSERFVRPALSERPFFQGFVVTVTVELGAHGVVFHVFLVKYDLSSSRVVTHADRIT
jgi:hypothetical protein